MGIKIYHINIRSWENNKYAFMIDISHHNPDIILLNETGILKNNQIKLSGYNSIIKSPGAAHGIVILIKIELSFENVIINDDNTLAIKLFTKMGPIIIATAYSPPREASLPTPSIYKIASYNFPIIMLADFNAHHSLFENTNATQNRSDPKGKQLYNIIQKTQLEYIGPDFKTYITKYKKGKPDIILKNHLFSIFNYRINPGEGIGSDHIPIILEFQTTPFKIIKPTTSIINSLNIPNFKKDLASHKSIELDGKLATEIDKELEKLMTDIQSATKANCKTSSLTIINTYKPTPEIKSKLLKYQDNCLNYYCYGSPTLNTLQLQLKEISNLVSTQLNVNWEKLVQKATENYGNPKRFWNSIKQLKGSNQQTLTCLTNSYYNDDSESDSFDTQVVKHITDKTEQAQLMSETWSKIFAPNSGREFVNTNTCKITQWFNSIKNSLIPDTLINKSKLIPDHPLLRPITNLEIINCFKLTKLKAPGLSKITVLPLKNLPKNCIVSINNIYNSIIASKYIPILLEKVKLIFLNKPNKDNKIPTNYRPICLIETLYKALEKIIANRLLYYTEHHHLLTEKQFGFRPLRSTQHAISLIQDAVLSNSAQRHITLIATRDVQKAFDTVWYPGLLYKIHQFPDASLDFLAFVYQYLTKRVIIPFFNNVSGPAFTPTAGVPQGSSFGPILYSIYVNDHPQPLYHSSLVSQFADDIIHVVRSQFKHKTKYKTVITRMNKELKQTLQWEQNWKIKSNPDKSTISVAGTNSKQISKHGTIKINNTTIPIKNCTKILGFNLAKNINSVAHIRAIKSRASFHLKKLNRFRSAPIKIKLHLYKSLIRPILEYPSYPLSITSKTSKRKLQSIQNRALRFINNIRLKDKIKIDYLHSQSKIEAFNIRLHNLASKNVNKIHEYYLCNKDNYIVSPYKLSDFEINTTPYRNKKRTLALRIKKHIYGKFKTKYKGMLLKTSHPINWKTPNPIYLA